MSSPTSVDFDLPPVTPTLPPDPTLQDYELASEYERRKLVQIRKTLEQLRADYPHLDDTCDNAMTGEHQAYTEQKGSVVNKENRAPQTPGHSKSSSMETTPTSGTTSTGHVRRKSSLNATAPEFVPSFLDGKKPENTSTS